MKHAQNFALPTSVEAHQEKHMLCFKQSRHVRKICQEMMIIFET